MTYCEVTSIYAFVVESVDGLNIEHVYLVKCQYTGEWREL